MPETDWGSSPIAGSISSPESPISPPLFTPCLKWAEDVSRSLHGESSSTKQTPIYPQLCILFGVLANSFLIGQSCDGIYYAYEPPGQQTTLNVFNFNRRFPLKTTTTTTISSGELMPLSLFLRMAHWFAWNYFVNCGNRIRQTTVTMPMLSTRRFCSFTRHYVSLIPAVEP